MLAIVVRQLYLMRGSPARVLPLFAWVAIDIVLWGFITRYLNSVANAQMDFVPALLGAVLLWDFFSRVMQGVTHGVPRRRLVAQLPQPVRHAAQDLRVRRGARHVSSIATSLVGLAVMLVLASAAFGLSFFSYGLLLIPFLLVLFLFGIALGIFAQRRGAAPRARLRNGSYGRCRR